MDSIPRGATARGVNRAVLAYLLKKESEGGTFAVLDIPCGQGEFLSTLKSFFPKATACGSDMAVPAGSGTVGFAAVDASRPFKVFEGQTFDYVISISGVMEFDNTLQFLESCRNHLRDEGTFIVTNDNLLTLRDRIEYLLFGKFRQYSAFMVADEPTWKILPLQNLLRILHDAGFSVVDLSYVSLKTKDWLWLPLAVLVYPLQRLYLQFKRSGMPLRQRLRMHPFKSLFYRHYVVVCEKRTAGLSGVGHLVSPEVVFHRSKA